MAPTVPSPALSSPKTDLSLNTSDNVSELVDLIADVRKTLKKNARETLKLKSKGAKALEDGTKTCFRSGSTVSLGQTWVDYAVSRPTSALSAATVSHFPMITSCGSSSQFCSLRLASSSTRAQSQSNSRNLKTLVFNTLDRIFQIRRGTPVRSATETKNNSTIVTVSAADVFKPNEDLGQESERELSLERDTSLSGSSEILDIVSSELPSENGDEDGENSWLYISDPLHIEEVQMYDSLNYTGEDFNTTATVVKEKCVSTLDKEESLIPDFNTNSFSREIAKRPSSTLQRPSITAQLQGTSPKTSALCPGIYVTPINVPVQPFGKASSEIRKQLSSSVPPPPSPDGALVKEVQEAFSYLYENGDDDDDEADEDSDGKENALDETSTSVRHISVISGDESVSVSLNSSVPPPPPLPSTLPPPPPPPGLGFPISRSGDGGALRHPLFPLKIFTEPSSSSDSIFNRLEAFEIGEPAKLKLKEKFAPLLDKKNNGKTKSSNPDRSFDPNKFQTISKFQLNTELFIRKWGLEDPNKMECFLQSISTLNANPRFVDMNCVATLPQPKEEEIKIIQRNNAQEKTQTAHFLMKLGSIPRLKEKLACLQFSLDFDESVKVTLGQIYGFDKACRMFTEAPEKLMKVISVLMSVISSLNSEGEESVVKIYGFDIQGLSKLASESSENGSSTFLHFLVEYILTEPSLSDAVDFYLDFNELSSLSRISLKDIMDRYQTWNRSLSFYKKELQAIILENQHNSTLWLELEFPNTFQTKAELTLQDISTRLNEASKLFQTCKECYGLPKSASVEMNEAEFFQSFYRFISAYRKVHKEVEEKRLRQIRTLQMRQNQAQIQLQQQNRRHSYEPSGPKDVDADKPPQDIPLSTKSKAVDDREESSLEVSIQNGGTCKQKINATDNDGNDDLEKYLANLKYNESHPHPQPHRPRRRLKSENHGKVN